MFKKNSLRRLFLLLCVLSSSLYASEHHSSEEEEKTVPPLTLHRGGSLINVEKHRFSALEREGLSLKLCFVAPALLSEGIDFTLNVLGASAAFYGTSGLIGLRSPENEAIFQTVSLGMGGLALSRYILITVLNTPKYQDYLKQYHQKNTWGKFIHTLSDPVFALRSSMNSLILNFSALEKIAEEELGENNV